MYCIAVANFSQSYNYFLYNLEDGYDYIKVVARYVTTPLYVGYKIPQTCDEERAAKIIARYYALFSSYEISSNHIPYIIIYMVLTMHN